MKYTKAIFTGAVAVTGSTAIAGEKLILAKELGLHGLDYQKIAQIYKNHSNINLNPNELLKVTRDEEGKHIRFETLDHLSVVVPIYHARGVANKDLFD